MPWSALRCLVLVGIGLIPTQGCRLFGESSRAPERSSQASCFSAQVPTDPALLGADEAGLQTLMRQAAEGIVAVAYHVEDCRVRFEVLESCRAPLGYAYRPQPRLQRAVLRSIADVFAALPLAAARLGPVLAKHGALRVDERIVGQLEAPSTLNGHRRGLIGDDCPRATHLVTAIDLGGASLVGASVPRLEGTPSFFARRRPPRAGFDYLAYTGDPRSCDVANRRGRRTNGCDSPLRVTLLPIDDEADVPARAMVYVPTGRFMMGDKSGGRDASPAHAVQLSAFEIDQQEVSAAEYARCVASGACASPQLGPRCTGGVLSKQTHPINCVTWRQARAYCKFVGKRLPTEAEWERAARGTDRRRYVWGDAWPPPTGVGNLAGATMQRELPHWVAIDGYDDGFSTTAPVGALAAPSPVGAQGMAGNVAEWVQDHYHPNYYRHSPRSDPKGPRRGQARVVRGASFGQARRGHLEVTARAAYVEDVTSMHIGFRCARTPE